ncbi:mdv1p [Saccharomyces arboricola H-6]|uniref:Mitochondrial division protein 1 n=1 Tax=Saccharomyces arboricola (strain H-6 / AS 2.3317 / CBS 10644) TaxID=1160507 RepID=J8PM14_SACAR|nr:mdv1p [Saccharomyces arboricola H-6]
MSVNDQITHIGKTLSTTASAFLSYQKSNSSTQDVLTNSGPYKNLLSNTVNNANSTSYLQKRKEQMPVIRSGSNTFEDIYSKTRRGDVFKNKFTDNKTCFRMLTYISNDLLNEIPTGEGAGGNTDGKLLTERGVGENSRKNTSKRESSLFQGFKSYLPIAELASENTERLQYNKNDTDNAEALSRTTEQEDTVSDLPNFQDSFLIPPGVETKKISSSYSPTALKSFSQTLVNSLEFLNIQKYSASSEVKYIDAEIEELKQKKEKLLGKIANIEQNQLLLEDNLKQIDDRMDFLEEYGLEIIEASSDENADDNISEGTASKNGGKGNSTIKSVTSDMSDQPARRKQQLREDNSSNKLGAFYNKSKKKHRKCFPSFQQLYEPGTKIGSIESAHDDFITCLDFDAPFGTLCTAGYLDHTVKIWDLSKQKKIGELAGHLATINCMQIDRDYGTLVTGGRDAALKLWNLNLAQQLYQENQNLTSPTSHIDSPCVYTFEAHIDEVTALSLDPSFLVSGSQDRTVRQWDLRSGKCMQTIDLSFANVLTTATNVDLSKSTHLTQRSERPSIGALQSFDAALATGTKDGIVRLWDLRSGKVIRTLEGHTDAITSLKFDSACLVTGSYDRTVRVWDLKTGLLSKFHAYSGPVLSLDFFQDNAAVVVANETAIQIYDSNKDESWSCVEQGNDVNVTAIKYKENYMAEGRGNGDVHIWAV